MVLALDLSAADPPPLPSSRRPAFSSLLSFFRFGPSPSHRAACSFLSGVARRRRGHARGGRRDREPRPAVSKRTDTKQWQRRCGPASHVPRRTTHTPGATGRKQRHARGKALRRRTTADHGGPTALEAHGKTRCEPPVAPAAFHPPMLVARVSARVRAELPGYLHRRGHGGRYVRLCETCDVLPIIS